MGNRKIAVIAEQKGRGTKNKLKRLLNTKTISAGVSEARRSLGNVLSSAQKITSGLLLT